MNPRYLFAAAAASYLANCLLGVGVATRRIDTSNVRWVHHALYISTSVLTAAAASSAVWSRSTAGVLLLPAAVPLAMIPRVSAKTAGHAAIAVSAAPFVAAATVKAWR